jgi:succinyl-diaminopimelate desuccinylase
MSPCSVTETPHAAVVLAMDLIRCPSVAPVDGGAQLYLRERFSNNGFDVHPVDVDGIMNTWACIGDHGPLVVFAVHSDVVPSGDVGDWTNPPFDPCVRDGMLFGRGAADMKGPLSAAVVAVERFLACQKGTLPVRIGFLVAGDEEPVQNHGTQDLIRFLKSRGESLDYCIVTEPTSVSVFGDTVKVGRRGSINGFLSVLGKQGHAAYPEFARNPVHQSMRVLHAMTERLWDEGDSNFPPAGFQITNMHSGTGAANVIPARLEVQFNVRHGPGLTLEQVDGKVRELLDMAGLQYKLECVSDALPFRVKQGQLTQICIESIEEVVGMQPQLSTGGGTSDARFVAPHCRELVEFGLVGDTSHHVDERVAVDELVQLTEVYQGMLSRISIAGEG